MNSPAVHTDLSAYLPSSGNMASILDVREGAGLESPCHSGCFMVSSVHDSEKENSLNYDLWNVMR